ncbi:unnamed protein product [Adineta ricciae]|uniref:Uncharacterized protein n=1 Tax=Adineta ricciae TaxID=249248 RepID=A0A815U2S2_ADIRI|nr:unnamed protein product [Adineta ricciae]
MVIKRYDDRARNHQMNDQTTASQADQGLKKTRTGRKSPKFPIELWNVYDRVSENLPRTNNSIEGWHNAFAQRVSIAHPTINKLTDKIRTEQSKFELDIALIRLGQQPEAKKNNLSKNRR